jgi:hypothetical protein
MNDKWRIKKQKGGYGEWYILQKRFLGFLWWYNPDNIDGCITGVYGTLEEAKEIHKKKTTPLTTEYLEI